MNNWFSRGILRKSGSSLTLEWLANVIEARPPGSEVARQLPRKAGAGSTRCSALAVWLLQWDKQRDCTVWPGARIQDCCQPESALSSLVFDKGGQKCSYSKQVGLTKPKCCLLQLGQKNETGPRMKQRQALSTCFCYTTKSRPFFCTGWEV